MSETTIEIKQRKCPACDSGNVSHSDKAHALDDFCLDCMTCGLFFREDTSITLKLEVGRKYLYVPEKGGMYTYIGMKGRVHRFRPAGNGDLLTLFGDEVMDQIVSDDTLELKAAVRDLLQIIDDMTIEPQRDERYKRAEKLAGPVKENWYPVIWVERDTGRKLAISKHDTLARALAVAEKWTDSNADWIEVWRQPGETVVWSSKVWSSEESK